MAQRHRVVIIGAGFGGLAAARALRREPVDVTLVDANNFHTFQPLLYQVATAGLDADDIGYPVRGIFRRQRNIAVRMARVTGVDLTQRTVTTSVGPPLPFDSLIVAAGAVSTSFGVPGVDEHAFTLKSLDDALAVRQHVLAQFERVVADADAHGGDGALTVAICGGGPTGVELAGGMIELFDHVLAKDFRHQGVLPTHVVVVEAADRLLGTFSEASGAAAARTLAARGVEVITGVGVRAVDADGVHLIDGRRIPARTVIWTAGVRADPLAASLGVPLGRGGRIVINAGLAVPGHPGVYAIGDIAADAEHPLPQVAQPAIQGGRHVARQIVRRLHGEPTEQFTYHDKGSMATIGRRAAVAELPGGMRLRGTLGWLAWLGLHIVYLMGFRNRLNVLVNWAWNYLTYDRGARLLTGHDERLEVVPNDSRRPPETEVWQRDPLIIGVVIDRPAEVASVIDLLRSEHDDRRFIGIVAADDVAEFDIVVAGLAPILAEIICTAARSQAAVDGQTLAMRALDRLGFGQDFVYTVEHVDDALRYARTMLADGEQRGWEGTAILVPGSAAVVGEARAATLR